MESEFEGIEGCLDPIAFNYNVNATFENCEYYEGPWYVAEDGNDESNNGSVDSPFATIQKAVDSANDGDDIYINPGLYVENIFVGPDDQRTLTIEGLGGPEEIIIDGDNDGRVFHFDGDNGSKNYYLNNLTIQHGNASEGSGIYKSGYNGLYLNNMHILNNQVSNAAPFDYGGAITVSSNIGAVLSLIDCVISGNYGSDNGGAVYSGGNFYMEGCVVSNNETENGGAAIKSYGYTSESTVVNSQFFNNTGLSIISFRGSNNNIENSIFQNNSASETVIYVYAEDSATFTNVEITNNFGSGGGITLRDGDISNCTLSNNGGPSIIYETDCIWGCDDENITITNSILYSPSEDYEILLGEKGISDYSELNISYSNVYGGLENIILEEDFPTFNWGDGNINEDPNFTSLPGGDFTLQWPSPCIDSGHPYTYDPDGTIVDM